MLKRKKGERGTGETTGDNDEGRVAESRRRPTSRGSSQLFGPESDELDDATKLESLSMSKGRDALSLLGLTLEHHQPWLLVTFVTIPFQITLSAWLIYLELWFSPHLDISELRKFDEKFLF